MTDREKIDKILKHVEKIDRGMYGDPDNMTPGVIERQLNDAIRIQRLEDSRKTQRYWIAGMITGLQAIWFFVIKLFVK